jgi:hypothetical protein
MFMLGGCPQGFPALPGLPGGTDGTDGTDGDTGDGTTADRSRHQVIFEDILQSDFTGTDSCLTCHSDKAREILDTAHWKWEGVTTTIAGLSGEVHGKTTLLNNL